jgi:hypothetical protein
MGLAEHRGQERGSVPGSAAFKSIEGLRCFKLPLGCRCHPQAAAYAPIELVNTRSRFELKGDIVLVVKVCVIGG